MNCGNNENVVIKHMIFYWIVWMMKMLLLYLWNWIGLGEWCNVGAKPRKCACTVGLMKMMLLNPWNLIKLCAWWKCCCYTYEIWLNCGNDEKIVFKNREIWLNCVNDENDDVKPMKFDRIVGMMKMLLLNPWNLVELWEWW